MKTKFVLIGIILLIFVAGWVWLAQKNAITNNQNANLDHDAVIFPAGNENLKAGNTYTLKWQNSSQDTIQIFLVDTSLKSEGASVSISDRVYGVPNNGSYEYKIPENTKPGIYEFEIGNLRSNTFNIVSN